MAETQAISWRRRPRPARRIAFAALGLLLVLCAPAHGPAQEPAGADVPVQIPPPGRYFGLNGDTVTPGHRLTTRQIADLARIAGANAIRGPLNWQGVEPERDRWSDASWGRYDRFYAAARNEGLTPILVMGNAPWWARTAVGQLCLSNHLCAFPPRPEMDREWAQFAAAAARRYPRAIFQIWNEPNLHTHWAPWAEPERYARLQAVAYDAIKRVNSEAMVLSGGFANIERTTVGAMAMREFVGRAYAGPDSIKGHIDALAFHPYPGPPRRGRSAPDLGAGSEYARGFAEIRATRRRAGDDVPIFVTEAGISTTQGVTRATQTEATRRIYRKTLAMNHVIGIVMHRIDEPRHPVAKPIEAGFSWLRTSGGYPPPAYPVYCAFVADAGNSYAGC